MLKTIYSTIIILFICGCNNGKNKKFEGTVTYKVSVVGLTEDVEYNTFNKEKYGETMKLTINAEGDIRRDYLKTGNHGYDYFIYKQKENKCYAKFHGHDTIIYADCSDNSLIFEKSDTLENEIINGKDCKGFYVTGTEVKGGGKVTLSYFYPEDNEFIDPELYKNYHDYFNDLSAQKMKGLYYKLVMDFGDYMVAYEIKNIESKTIDKKVFELPQNVILKKIN
ncbi:MAG: hypothetical protein H7321_05490 [Bacteroidia bacterium]|nr:hypothetical protein [Bacteroidia bacterium]